MSETAKKVKEIEIHDISDIVSGEKQPKEDTFIYQSDLRDLLYGVSMELDKILTLIKSNRFGDIDDAIDSIQNLEFNVRSI